MGLPPLFLVELEFFDVVVVVVVFSSFLLGGGGGGVEKRTTQSLVVLEKPVIWSPTTLSFLFA